ncbi:MAG: glycoside hydrolase family 16 protein [Bacteroidaceae bacterium]|nr:glycoside hydrolase family 16 protein [Bacteroidaceae bacterium]
MKKIIFALSIALTSYIGTQAQVAEVTFDTDDYASIGVYDAWENSPFRKGLLQGNVAVIDNPHTEVSEVLGTAPNATAKVLAVQRSRYGSNQFGARIDLKTPFSLKPETQYIHVLVHRPVSGRVMLMGLGKHREAEWAGQSAETEQFWSISSTTVAPDMWSDAVFAVKGVSGVDIYSLILVPECESPHNRTEDFIAYVDQIVVNNSSAPMVSYDEYPVNFDRENGRATRTDRGILSVGLQNVNTIAITAAPSTSDPLYRDRMDATLPVKAGQSVKPVIGYQGTWMCGYAYVDFGRDGKFSYTINADGTPADGSDLVAYSAYQLRNSEGATLTNNNSLNIPNFTIPEGTPTGFYRMRFKVDWNEIDPGGSATIQSDGGGVVDVRLNIHADNVSVVEDNRNGEILNADGTSLVSTTPFGQALTVKLNPENGFAYNGIRIRHGYGLTGDSLIHGTPQYVDEYVWRDQFDANDCYTIKAEWVDGDLLLEGLFVEKGTEIEFNYPINYDKATATITRTDRRLNGVTMAGTTWTLPAGKKLYNEDMTKTFLVNAGQDMQVQFNFTGNWMNGYFYIDRDQDGQFSYDINADGTPAEGSDLMTYSHANTKNSLGQNLTGAARNVLNPPAFTMPALADGFYAIRFKIDWSELDPAGNTTDNNNIIYNGGGIADARLRVYSSENVSLTLTEHPNGTLTTSNGDALPLSIPFNTPLTLFAAPTEGYKIDTLYVTHGNLDAPKQYVHGVPQWLKAVYTSDDFFEGAFTLPAEMIDGDVVLLATFVVDEEYTPTALSTIETTNPARANDWYDLQGRRIAKPSAPGIYLRAGKKIFVK